MKQNVKHITALIDGEPVRVKHGLTVLDAARQAGIYIPTLCHLENLKPYGGCRLCIVEIKGFRGYPTACTTPLDPDMEILTTSPELQCIRRNILEMTLSEHPYTCLVCRDNKECGEFMHTTRKAGTITGCNFCTNNGDCELQDLVDYLDLDDIRYPIAYRGIPPVKDNPFYDLDYNLCVLCGRCVRVCNEERHSNVLAFIKRGNATLVGTAFHESQAEAGCEFCGACVDVCPTGSISGKLGKWAGPPDRSTTTTCPLCSVGCPMNVNVRDSRVVEVGPAPGKRINPPQLCLRGKFIPGEITHHPERVKAPMIRKKDRWIEVTWDETIRFTAGKLRRYRESGFALIGSAQDTLEENYSLQKFVRLVMKSNNIDLFGSYPERESAGLIQALIAPPARFDKDDIQKADTILIIGSDASVSHPLLENGIRKAHHNGRQVLYANPRPTRTSGFSTLEINYLPGTEYHFLYVLLAGIAREMGSMLPAGIHGQFGEKDLQSAADASGIDPEKLGAFIRSLSRTRNLCILVGDDALHSGSGKDFLVALGNLKSLKQQNASCTILVAGYEGNLQGGLLAGAHPDFLPGMDAVSDPKAIRKWSRFWGDRLSSSKGLISSEILAEAGRGNIQALIIAGDVPPSRQLRKVKFLVQMNMFPTPLSEYAHVLLPVTGFLENGGHYLSMDSKIRKLTKILSAQGKSRTIPQILTELAAEISGLDKRPDSSPVRIWKEMRSTAGISFRPAMNGRQKFLSMVRPATQRETGGNSQVTVNYGKAGYNHNGYDHFRYRGNLLSSLVPDLKAVLDAQAKGNKRKV